MRGNRNLHYINECTQPEGIWAHPADQCMRTLPIKLIVLLLSEGGRHALLSAEIVAALPQMIFIAGPEALGRLAGFAQMSLQASVTRLKDAGSEQPSSRAAQHLAISSLRSSGEALPPELSACNRLSCHRGILSQSQQVQEYVIGLQVTSLRMMGRHCQYSMMCPSILPV